MGEVFTLRPVPNLWNLSFMEYPSFEGVFVINNGGIWCSKDELFDRYGGADILKALKNVVDNE